MADKCRICSKTKDVTKVNVQDVGNVPFCPKHRLGWKIFMTEIKKQAKP